MPGDPDPALTITGKLKVIIPMMNTILCGHAAKVLAGFPTGCIDLGITSPPYYGIEEDKSLSPWSSYNDYLDDMESGLCTVRKSHATERQAGR
jgi:DNA modification methylase